MSITRLAGKTAYKTFPSTAVALVAAAAVQFDEGGNIAIAATNKQVVGVTVAAYALSTNPVIDIIDDGSIWRFTTFTGTMAQPYVGKTCDLTAGVTLALATDTNHDLTIVGGDIAGNTYVDAVFNQAGLARHVAGLA
jgi:hypothetical protein